MVWYNRRAGFGKIVMSPPIQFRRCPRCAGWVATNALNCSKCGDEADDEAEVDDASLGDTATPWHHQVLWIRLAGILGLASFFLTYNAIACAAFASNGLEAVVAWAVVGGTVLLGIGVCSAGVILAFRAVTGMGGVEVDGEGRETAKFWGILAGLSLLVYWGAVWVWVYHLF